MIERGTYTGGKAGSGVVQRLANRIPPHRTRIVPFAGKCALTLSLAPAERIVLLDRDPAVIDWWRMWRDWTPEGQQLAPYLTLVNDCGIEYLRKRRCWIPTPETFVFADPPYVHDTRSDPQLYAFELDDGAHVALLEELERLPCPVMLCGYPSTLYDDGDWLEGWRTYDYLGMTRGGPKRERLWMNYAEPLELHDYRFVGEDYRERENVRRKAARWVERLRAMPAMERYAILAALDQCAGAHRRPHRCQLTAAATGGSAGGIPPAESPVQALGLTGWTCSPAECVCDGKCTHARAGAPLRLHTEAAGCA